MVNILSICIVFYCNIKHDILKKMDAVVACSKSMQKAFLSECNMSMDCVQNAVNTDLFHPISFEGKIELRKELGNVFQRKKH